MAEFDYHDALIQIEMLFQSHILSFGFKEYSLETFADKKYFRTWKGREGCEDTDQMRAGLNIDGILGSADPSENEVLTYLQYTLNIAELCRRSFNAEDAPGYEFDIRNYTELLSRIREILKRLLYDVKYVAEKELIYLVPHDPAADSVEATATDPVANAVTEYRSAELSGKLDQKRQLLAELAKTVADYEKTGSQSARLDKKIGFLTDSFGISEEGSGQPKYEVIQKLNEDEVEDWYDETYQLLLLRILLHQNADRMKKVDNLAKECGVENLEISEEEMARLLSVKGVPEPEEEPEPDGQEAADAELSDRSAERNEKKEVIETARKSHTLRNVITAIIIADILFVFFILCYLFLR